MHRIRHAWQILYWELVQGNRTILHLDQLHAPSEPFQPLRDIRRVPHTTTQEQEPGGCQRKSHGHFVVQSTLGIRKHLVFVENEEPGCISAENALALGLQCRH